MGDVVPFPLIRLVARWEPRVGEPAHAFGQTVMVERLGGGIAIVSGTGPAGSWAMPIKAARLKPCPFSAMERAYEGIPSDSEPA